MLKGVSMKGHTDPDKQRILCAGGGGFAPQQVWRLRHVQGRHAVRLVNVWLVCKTALPQNGQGLRAPSEFRLCTWAIAF